MNEDLNAALSRMNEAVNEILGDVSSRLDGEKLELFWAWEAVKRHMGRP